MLGLIKVDGAKPGYLQLAQAIIEAIQDGRLPVGTVLLPSRVLAESLEISRDTALRAYRHLQSLGWIDNESTRGMYVRSAALASESEPQLPLSPANHRRLSRFASSILDDRRTDVFSTDPIIYGAVPRQNLPLRRWAQAVHSLPEFQASRDLQYELDVLGLPQLRSALSTYLNLAAGLSCSAGEVVVFNSSFNALMLLCRVFLEPGDTIAMENPGFGGVRDTAAFLGLRVVPIELDDSGLSVEALRQTVQTVKVVYVSPNHQEPTGITMTLARRKELLAWAQKNNALIIEDDYDGLFHYGAAMPASIKSLDTQDNVVYLGSFWQVLYPLTTLCHAVLPRQFVAILQTAKRHTASLSEGPSQAALAELLQQGYLQKHLRKLERQFAPRRRVLLYELKRIFGRKIQLSSQTGGLTIMATFQGFADRDLLTAAESSGLSLTSTERFYASRGGKKSGEFLIYFAGLGEANVRKIVEDFADGLGHS